MVKKKENPENIGKNDIFFECPLCSKSLAIDGRGAGLTIKCPDCGESIDVPIPEGVDITDIDRLGVMEVRGIGDAEESLRPPESPDEIRHMLTELEELRFRRRYLEKQLAATARWLPAIQTQVDSMRTALDKIEDALTNLSEPSADKTQSLV